MFRSMNRSLSAVRNVSKFNAARLQRSFESQTASFSYDSKHHYNNSQSKKWSPLFLMAGGAILYTGLKSSHEVYADEGATKTELAVTEVFNEVEILEPTPEEENIQKPATESNVVLGDVIEELVEDAVEDVVEEAAVPEPLPAFPEEVQYLLIGGGTASFSAMRAIKKVDVMAKVLIVTDEAKAPYMRPPLSKELWYTKDKAASRNLKFEQWNGKQKSIFYNSDDFYCKANELNAREEGGVAIATGKKVVKLNARKNIATLDDGTEIKYQKCLLATGGTPKQLPVIQKASEEAKKNISVFRNVKDYLKLENITDNCESVTVIGGGFLGSELSCALGVKSQGKRFKVNQVFKEKGNMAKVLPEYLTMWTTNKVKNENVNVISETVVESVDMEGEKVKLTLSNGKELLTDHVVVSVGLDVDTQLAKSAGLEIDEKLGGYRVNTELQARSNIWVAGDASCFYDVKLGRRRVEHHDHAVVTGRLAGENMTGAQKSYYHQSMFWSDLGPDVGYEAIGVCDASLPTVAVFAKATTADLPRAALNAAILGDVSEAEPAEPSAVAMSEVKEASEDFGKGVIFYLKDNIVVGVLLWNIFQRMALARKIIREQQEYDDFGELAKLFKINQEEFNSDQ